MDMDMDLDSNYTEYRNKFIEWTSSHNIGKFINPFKCFHRNKPTTNIVVQVWVHLCVVIFIVLVKSFVCSKLSIVYWFAGYNNWFSSFFVAGQFQQIPINAFSIFEFINQSPGQLSKSKQFCHLKWKTAETFRYNRTLSQSGTGVDVFTDDFSFSIRNEIRISFCNEDDSKSTHTHTQRWNKQRKNPIRRVTIDAKFVEKRLPIV